MAFMSALFVWMMFSVLLVAFGENLRGAEIDESISLDGARYGSRQQFSYTGARCRTANLTDDELRLREAEMDAMQEEMGDALTVKKVRVFFHVITTSSGKGSLAASSINAQMNVLNRAYQGSIVQFVLSGTTTTRNDAWAGAKMGSNEEKQMKQALRTGVYRDLNIYTTVQSDNTLGWATFPGNVGSDYRMDGVVVDFRSLPGGNFAPYNLGQTVSHETGHWLGLQHTFNGGCNQDASAGDKIADTPAEASPNFGCPASRNTCPGSAGALAGNDPIHNYMDYSDDSCMNNFTGDQRIRVKKQWALYRAKK